MCVKQISPYTAFRPSWTRQRVIGAGTCSLFANAPQQIALSYHRPQRSLSEFLGQPRNNSDILIYIQLFGRFACVYVLLIAMYTTSTIKITCPLLKFYALKFFLINTK